MVYSFIISYVVFSTDVKRVESVIYGLAISLHFIGWSYHLGKKHAHLPTFIYAATMISLKAFFN
ncbi:hypothetical protein ACQJ18_14470 [Priestia megaterium]|uniref:hypothetical protein n=1 Tax=Priestia megaterium TaxID=1404 RepID=UPI003CFCE17C